MVARRAIKGPRLAIWTEPPVRKRICILLLASFALTGCSQSWEQERLASPAGGTGLMVDGNVAEGPMAVSSISQLPSHDSAGAVAPFGAQGTAAAYEYLSGYKVGAGDRLTIRVAGESDITADYLVDGSGNISLPYIQTVHIAGMTTPQVEKLITAQAAQWLSARSQGLGSGNGAAPLLHLWAR